MSYLDWITCDCSEDYGPCEHHCTVLASRDGAAMHTADELCALFIDDAAEIIRHAEDTPDSLPDVLRDAIDLASEYWEENPDGGWVDDSSDLTGSLADAAFLVESWLPDGVLAYWEDGYTIVKVSDDCPLNYETEEEYHAATDGRDR